MHQENAKRYSSPSIDSIIAEAPKNVPFEFTRMPWEHPELKRGTSLLESEGAQDSYMAAYGDAHKQKAFKAIEFLPLWEIKGPFEICDWGCGQGIASMCLLQVLTQRNLSDEARSLHLIEPSKAALERELLFSR